MLRVITLKEIQRASLGPGLLKNFHVKIHVRLQRFSNLASDQMPGLKILVN